VERVAGEAAWRFLIALPGTWDYHGGVLPVRHRGDDALHTRGRRDATFDTVEEREGGAMTEAPSTGKSLEYLVDRARRMAMRYAEVSPYSLNPDPEVWGGIVKGIGRQAYTGGWPYCP
jgi:hypothetical protein